MVTIISGTNRPGSNTLKVAKYYQDSMAKKGQEANVLSLTDLPGNLIVSDLYGKRSAEFEKIQQLMTATEKFVFIIPEYNGSFPGILKTFIDACDFPESFYDKKACLVGISSGKYGNIRGIDHFGGVCAYLHLNVLPLRLHISAIKTELDENDAFYKEDTLKFTGTQIDKFIAY
ncbi:NADPH-dependent FMN reductase [Pedobacter sp. L105]|uniref:NADPH-dependent FMN reductase n=1 Tax=Pedobacter sp. L105 TaxID=1641871 RepID=UPI00131ADD5A|nr:NAD(P)H-dependent oxidoreductase [Pedobacter sp. L105]